MNTTESKPLTDEQLADVKRLIAAAKLGPMVSVHIVSPGYEHCANLCTRLDGHKSDYPVAMMQAEWADAIAAVLNAMPGFITRLERAEAERDEVAERMPDLQNERDAAVYVMELEGHATDHGKALLATRDARMKREGAAAKLNEMADGGLNWDAVTLRREAESVLTEGA